MSEQEIPIAVFAVILFSAMFFAAMKIIDLIISFAFDENDQVDYSERSYREKQRGKH